MTESFFVSRTIWGVNDTTFVDLDVTADTTVTYAVTVVNDDGFHVASDTVTVEILFPELSETVVTGVFIIDNVASMDDLAAVGGGGDFVIRGGLSISDFAGRELDNLNLTAIYGFLNISDNESLEDLGGLSNLRTVTGHVSIGGNTSLQDLQGLEGLTEIGGRLSIADNTGLTSLRGLESVQSIDGGLRLFQNWDLRDLAELSSVLRIGKGLQWFQRTDLSVIVEWNPSLISLRGPQNLTAIEGGVAVSLNETLADLDLLRNAQQVGGDLTITSNHNLRDLSALGELREVRGTLEIRFSDGLLDLRGLSHLETVGDSLKLTQNEALQTLEGLDNLRAVGGSLVVDRNGSLASLGTLENLTSLDGELRVRFTDLVNLDGLGNITRVGGLEIANNQLLLEIAGLGGLRTIDGDLRLSGNTSLVSIEGLRNLQEITGVLSLWTNSALDNLEPLSSVSSISGFELVTNRSLSSIEPLKHLFTELSGDVWISRNDNLTSSDVFTNLTQVAGNLTLDGSQSEQRYDMPNLGAVGGSFSVSNVGSLEGFGSLQAIGGTLNISFNEALANLGGLESLTSIRELRLWNNESLVDIAALSNLSAANDVLIALNPALTNLEGLNGITSLEGYMAATSFGTSERGGSLTITENQGLATVDGLDNLASVFNRAEIGGNGSLEHLDGLRSLTRAGALSIVSNVSLRNVDGLRSLTEVEENLSINDNPLLTDLDGLESLLSVGSLNIRGNSSLADRIANALADSLSAQGGIVSGFFDVGANSPDPTLILEAISIRDSSFAVSGVVVTVRLLAPQYLDLTSVPLVTEGLIYLGNLGPLNLDRIEWDATLPPGTSIVVRTRTGDTVVERLTFFNANGNQVTEREYDRLFFNQQGEIVSIIEPGTGWSDWSRPYDQSGDEVDSPSGRLYMQIQVTYTSSDPEVVPVLRGVILHVSEYVEVPGGSVVVGASDELIVSSAPDGLENTIELDSVELQLTASRSTDSGETELEGTYEIILRNRSDDRLKVTYELQFLDDVGRQLAVFVPEGQPVDYRAEDVRRESGVFAVTVPKQTDPDAVLTVRVAVQIALP